MFVEFGGPHHLPHFHAYYGKDVAVYRLGPIELLEGGLPRRTATVCRSLGGADEEELLADWELLQSGRKPLPIEPLEHR